MSKIEKEFEEYDRNNQWPQVYQKIKNEASLKSISAEHSVGEARKPENRSRNRYRDVSPYDHSRVVLQKGECDYINASLIQVPECNRRYILSQGPLEHTAAHFWQMIWEQNSKAVIMLNRVIEKGTLKCHQYWPLGEDDDDEMVFEDTGLKVTLMEEQTYEHYIVRTLDLEDIESGDNREVLHFHYITWPDFGVPSSPIAFLSFLEEVQGHGVLESDVGPAVIHCSAGIGRSGTFCLVDSILLLVKKTSTLNGIDVHSLLISMRSFRMGLIQTPEQLRFSYLAIIEGSKQFVPNARAVEVNDVLEEYLDMSGVNKEENPPLPPQRTSSLSPTKPKHTPPPPPPRRGHPEGTNDSDSDKEEPPEKRTKKELPSPPTSSTSPAKPPRSSLYSEHNDHSSDTTIPQNVLANSINNNPESKEDTGARSFIDNIVGGNGDQDTGQTDKTQASKSAANSTAEGISEPELRHRRREERKKKTQEMIKVMQEKQKHSETWKKRKTYYKPIAIGLTLLLGGILLYKLYW